MPEHRDRIMGLDVGLTVTKAVVFDCTAVPLVIARRRIPQDMPAPRHVERDMSALWSATAQAMADAAAQAGQPERIAAIGFTAHGDGVYLLDKRGAPLGSGILSLDSRAGDQVAA